MPSRPRQCLSETDTEPGITQRAMATAPKLDDFGSAPDHDKTDAQHPNVDSPCAASIPLLAPPPLAYDATELVVAPPSNMQNKTRERNSVGFWCALGGGAVCGIVGGVACVPLIATSLGFAAAGIASGSIAASMMSSAAIVNGGGVAAWSLVAALQSVGAVGVFSTTGAGTALLAAGGVTGGVVGALGGGALGCNNKVQETVESWWKWVSDGVVSAVQKLVDYPYEFLQYVMDQNARAMVGRRVAL